MHRTPHRNVPAATPRCDAVAVCLFALMLLLAACGSNAVAPTPAPAATASPLPPAATSTPTPTPTLLPTPEGATGAVPAYGYTVVNSYPHDEQAYTQGLQFVDGVFYEGTGLEGRSSLRKVEIESGKVLQQHDLEDEFFGEGIVVIDDKIWQLTWQEQVAILYDRESFTEIKRVAYPTQGWGLTYDGSRLIMSDGTPTLYFRDPGSFDEIGRIDVTYLGQPLNQINELEYINGEVWANVYQTDFIARINPETGVVTSIVDLAGILANETVTGQVDVLNGIAWDAAGERLFVTGKLWPKVYEITLQQVGWAQ